MELIRKIVVIETCAHCPHFIDLGRNIFRCAKEEREISIEKQGLKLTIPKWCKLLDDVVMVCWHHKEGCKHEECGDCDGTNTDCKSFQV